MPPRSSSPDRLRAQGRPDSLAAVLARQLLAVDAGEIDRVLADAVADATRFVRCDRGLIALRRGRETELVASHEWAPDDFVDRWSGDVREGLRAFRWAAKQIAAGSVLAIPDVRRLPDEARDEREVLLAHDVKSLLAIPVRSSETTIGFQIFEASRRATSWDRHELDELERVGELIAIALERKCAEEERLDSDLRFQTLTEHATELISELDADGRYAYASPSFTELLGYDPDELIGRSSRDIIHPQDLEDSCQGFRSAFDAFGTCQTQHRLRHRDGHWLWF